MEDSNKDKDSNTVHHSTVTSLGVHGEKEIFVERFETGARELHVYVGELAETGQTSYASYIPLTPSMVERLRVFLNDPLGLDGEHRGSCGCSLLPGLHPYATSGCEYHNHHCESCHGRGLCTSIACEL